MIKENFVRHIEKSLKANWDYPAFSDYKGKTLTYSEVSEKIIYLHQIFRALGIKKGDKISLLGKNSSNWASTFIAIVTYGAVAVPILPDFHPGDIYHIVNHSDSVLLFSSNILYDKIDEEEFHNILCIMSIDNLEILYCDKDSVTKKIKHACLEYDEKYIHDFSKEDLNFPQISNDDLAAIVYTSGTTGFSKGVMLHGNSLIANILFAENNMPLKARDTIVSFLPLAHSYGCAFEFLFPLSVGCHITFINKLPSPRILIKAFKEVKPRLILSVPIIIDKIYKKQIKPLLKKPVGKLAMKLPGIKNVLKNKIRNTLIETFGGNFFEIIIGGAALNKEVESFLRDIKFPITVGYGMTECGPLISYAGWKTNKLHAVGPVIDSLELKIDSEDPYQIEGEILVKGENVMLGYYKNKKATEESLDKDGWLHTGDLGLLDKDGYVYIKGRSKSMILGPSGQNIYPEEIESRLNNMPFVQESLVLDKDNNLYALVYPDYEAVDERGISEGKLQEIIEIHRQTINEGLASYSKLVKIKLYPEEFEKTPTKKIKRFLYKFDLE